MRKAFDSMIRFLAVASASACLLVSCVQERVQPDAVGYLACPVLDVDLTVEDMAATKASVDLPSIPDNSLIEFEVEGADGWSHECTGPWTENLVMPVGAYTIKASYGSNTFGTPYLYGEVSGVIEALDQEVPSLKMSLGNALVRVTVSSELAEHFMPSAGVEEWSSADRVLLNGDCEAVYGEWTYVPAGEAVNIRISGVNSAGSPAEFAYSLPSVEAGIAYDIVCSPDLPEISLEAEAFATRLFVGTAVVSGEISDENRAKLAYEVSESSSFAELLPLTVVSGVDGVAGVCDGAASGRTYYVRARIGNLVSPVVEVVDGFSGEAVSATHYNDGSGNLAGTDAVLDFGFPSGGLLSKLHESGALSVSSSLFKSGVSSAVRASSAVSGVAMGGDTAGWPYLPQTENGGSSYTLQVVQTLGGGHALEASVGGIVVDAPEFEVSLGQSYTSYDYGVGNNGFEKTQANVDFANTLTGAKAETIFDVSIVAWGVSDALMNNTNYSNGRSRVYKFDNADTTPPAVGTKTSYGSLSWDRHTIYAGIDFDGVHAEEEKVHHITGLPYSAMPNNTDKYKWVQTANSNTSVGWNYAHGYGDRTNVGSFFKPEYVYEYYYYGVQLQPSGGGGTYYEGIYFDSFHVPQDVNVSIDNSYYRNGSLLSGYYLICGGTTLVDESGSRNEMNIKSNLSGVLKPSSDSSEQIRIEGKYGAANTTSYYLVTSVTVKYR